MQTLRDLGFVWEPELALSNYQVLSQLKKILKSSKFSFNEEMIEALEARFANQDETVFFEGARGV